MTRQVTLAADVIGIDVSIGIDVYYYHYNHYLCSESLAFFIHFCALIILILSYVILCYLILYTPSAPI